MIVKRLWFPCYSQLAVTPVRVFPYWYSLWIGFSTPILNLPRILWVFFGKPLIFATMMAFSFIVTSLVAGVTGRAAGLQKLSMKIGEDAAGV